MATLHPSDAGGLHGMAPTDTERPASGGRVSSGRGRSSPGRRHGAADTPRSRDGGPASTPGAASPASPRRELSTSATRGRKNAKSKMFSHEGVWVRPASVGPSIAFRHAYNRSPPIEDHTGIIDPSAGMDLGHAILAFEFIDRINDDVFHHYLPLIDNTLGKELGLEHEPLLWTPEPEVGTPSSQLIGEEEPWGEGESTVSCAEQLEEFTPSPYHGESSASGAFSASSPSSRATGSRASKTRLGQAQEHTLEPSEDTELPRGCAIEQGSVGASPLAITRPGSESVDISTTSNSRPPSQLWGPGGRTSSASPMPPVNPASTDPEDDLVASDFDDVEARAISNCLDGNMCQTSLISGPTSGLLVASTAEAHVWPHACEVQPLTSRSQKLRSVDSLPDPAPTGAFNSMSSRLFSDSLTQGTLSTQHGMFSLPAASLNALPAPDKDSHDPALVTAPRHAMYGAGGSRVRREGQLAELKARPPRVPRPAREGSEGASLRRKTPQTCTAPGACGSGDCRVGSGQTDAARPPGPAAIVRPRGRETRQSSRAVGGGGTTACPTPSPPDLPSVATAALRSPPFPAPVVAAMSQEEEPSSWPPRVPSPAESRFEDLLAMHLQGGATQANGGWQAAERRTRRANSTCPFSHEQMDCASGLLLRCGHRFALEHLGVARRAGQLCCKAGFAQKDSLICPLCGDQDGTSKPGASKVLTAYSTSTDAYLGDLRRDWQKPLHLPIPPDQVGTGRAPALARLPIKATHPGLSASARGPRRSNFAM